MPQQPRRPAFAGPDFSRTGELVEWSYREALDDVFVERDVVGRAFANIGQDVELARWPADENDPLVRQVANGWWPGQAKALRTFVGARPGYRITIRARRDGDEKVGYLRVNRKRLDAVREAS
jgi:hypothetical protein